MSNPARPAQIERRTLTARPRLDPPKKRAWSHQDELKDAIGKIATLSFVNGATCDVQLVEVDQFALKVRLPRSQNGQSVVTFWKHALVGYEIKE